MNSFWITTCFYKVSLFVLIFLLIVVIAMSATDIIVQALSTAATASGTFKYSNLVVVGVSYALLAIATFSITCRRFLKVRRMLRDTAKSHIPTNDLPKEVAVKVQHGFLLASRILQAIKPLSCDINHPGWANPDTIAFEGVDLKRAVTRTPVIIENTATSISDMYTRPSFVDIRQYINFLIRQGIVDKGIGLVYLEGYERARFSKYGPTEQEYMNIMKHLAAILNQLGYHLHQTISTRFIDNTPQRIDIMISGSDKEHHGIIERYGASGQSLNSQASGESRRSASSHWNRNNNSSAYSSTCGNLTHHSYNRLHRTLRPHSIPGDDDVISLAQSVATWSSRSAQPHFATGFDGDQNEDYDERLRHVIYDCLMKPHN